MTTEVIGYSRKELIEVMLGNGIHCSVDRFVALAVEIQQRAIAERDLPALSSLFEALGDAK